MNTPLTAETRPRISSGVSICTSVWRTTTLMLSRAPTRNIIANESQNHCERPKMIVASAEAGDRPEQRHARASQGRQVGQQHGHADGADGVGRLEKAQAPTRRRAGFCRHRPAADRSLRPAARRTGRA